MSSDSRNDITEVRAEPVVLSDPGKFAYLAEQRGLIVRRALLASAIRGFLPVPVMDDVLARRVRAGLYQKLASGRQVDLPPASATLLAAGDDGSTAVKLTLAAAAMVAAKFAGRKFLAVLAAGRSADEMARSFYSATLFDHYCAKLHVGGPLTPAQADHLRACLHAVSSGPLPGPVRDAFAQGSRVLGRSLLEAPRWLGQRIASLGELFVHSGGNPDVLDALPEETRGDFTWLDRAAQTVELAMARAGNEHWGRIVQKFDALCQRASDDEG
jgi:hypothetical protein